MFKRAMDVLLSAVLLVVLSPLLLGVAWLTRLRYGRPIIFKHIRAGLHGKPFTLYKFRTMTNERGSDGRLLSDDQRMTRMGRVLRSLSLDELPELVNVLKGDMSLVGPRPLLMGYLDRYTAEQMRRHEVKPGITGLAQVSGRNALTWEKRFELDVWYVDNHTLWLDLKIAVLTVLKIVQREGVSPPNGVTMEEFLGSGEKKA